MAIAYLRVSTKKQDVENQKNEINEFARERGMEIKKWHKEIVSGKCNKNSRKLGAIIRNMKKDETLIVSELSRLSRTAFEAIEILNCCLKKKVNLHCVKENYSCTDDLPSIILGFISSLFSQMERNLIGQRTKEALARKKSEGVVLGRPVGSSKIWKTLISKNAKIKELLNKKVAKTKIALMLGISRVTLYKFIATL